MSEIDRQRFGSRSLQAVQLLAIVALILPLPAWAGPTIEITSVPPYGVSGFIAGEVTGVDLATPTARPFSAPPSSRTTSAHRWSADAGGVLSILIDPLADCP